jgi:outer membrane murein-binding lipoprotein Lpp
MENNSGENQGGNKKIYWVIIGILLLLNGVAVTLLIKEKKTSADVTTEKVNLKTEYDKLQNDFDTQKADLNMYMGKSTELDSILTVRNAEIEKVQADLKKAYASGSFNTKKINEYKSQLAALQSENEALKKRVDELTAQNQELSSKNIQVGLELEKEKQTTAQQGETIKSQQEQIELGSLLQPQGLKIEAIKKKGSGKEVAVPRIKAADELRICFATGENKILKPGPLKLYVRVINPKGETISVADQGSGTLTTDKGETIQYTKPVDTEWDGTSKNICVYWSQNIKDAGNYQTEVYQGNHLIGTANVLLK